MFVFPGLSINLGSPGFIFKIMKHYIDLEKVLKNYTEVVVLSYGYMQYNRIFGNHYEPFAHKRQIKFTISNGEFYNPTFEIDDLHPEDFYFYIEDGVVYVDDPNICCYE